MIRVVLLFLTLIIATPAHALVSAGVDPLTISVSPRYPKPFDTITIRLQSSLLDLLSSTITIRVNDVVVADGLSERTATAVVGGTGEETVIVAEVVAEGQTFTKELRLRPADLALIVESSSTAHPFYKGATLPAAEAPVRLLAFADFRNSAGAQIPPESLVYTWRLGERVLQDQSGAGKSVLQATAPLRYRDARVLVTVSDPVTGFSAESGVTVTPADPLVRVYRNDPLLGVRYEEAVSGAISLKGEEETFRAVPYYFSGAPVFLWTINSVEQGTAPDITLRATGGAGSATVAASVRDASAFSSAVQNLTVQFGASRPTGIFGF
jgi:hypothetical protein